MSVDEYLRADYKPAGEYRDGLLTRKPMPMRKHSQTQFLVAKLVDSRFPAF